MILPDQPTMHWQYAKYIYDNMVRKGPNHSTKLPLSDGTTVLKTSSSGRIDVIFHDAQGVKIAWINCPSCTGATALNLSDQQLQGTDKLNRYHELASLVKNALQI
jgi:hypothetical protein